ncbi:MAG: iron chaperone [Dehalococcoidia bacterium]
MPMTDFATPEDYLASLPDAQRAGLETLRSRIRSVLPGATERMWYRMPTFVTDKPVLAYAASRNHSGLYVMSTTVLPSIVGVLEGQDWSGGTLRFPVDRPPAVALLRTIAKAKLAELEAQSAAKPAKKAPPSRRVASKKDEGSEKDSAPRRAR